jgi:hypothetical protein
VNSIGYPFTTTLNPASSTHDRFSPLSSTKIDIKYQTRSQIGWDFTCPKDREFLADMKGDVNRLTAAQLAVLVINVLLGLYIGVFHNCYELNHWEDDTPEQVQSRRYKTGFVVIGNFFKIIPLIIELVLSFHLNGTFQDLKHHNGGMGCATGSESQTNSNIRFFADETDKQRYFNVALIVGSVLEIGFELFSLYKSF